MIPRSGREVSRIEGFSDAVFGFALTHVLSVMVGLVSIVLAPTVPIQWISTAGVIYAVQGPLHWRNGVLLDRERAKRFPSASVHAG